MNNDEIKLKSSKMPLIIGIIALGIWLLVEGMLLKDVLAGESSWVVMAVSSIYPSIILGVIGVVLIMDYFKKDKKMRTILEKYGETNLVSHVHQDTIKIFQKRPYDDWVYFTNKFVVGPSTAIIPYGEISWMYKSTTRHKNTSSVSIAFVLLDGTTYYLCDNPDDADIEDIMNLCRQYNPNIVFGYTKEAQAQHDMNVKRYKNGMN